MNCEIFKMATEHMSQSPPGMCTRALARQTAGLTGASIYTSTSCELSRDLEERSPFNQQSADVSSSNLGINNLYLDSEPVPIKVTFVLVTFALPHLK